MSGNIVLWAFLNGVILGAVWIAIVLLRRERRSTSASDEVIDNMQRRLDALEQVDERVAQIAERVDYTEHLLAQQPQRQPMDHKDP